MDTYVDAIVTIKEDLLNVEKLNSEFTPVETEILLTLLESLIHHFRRNVTA